MAASADAVLASNVRVQIALVSDFVLLGMNDLITTRVDQARQLLAEARNATDAKRVMDMAHAVETYAKRQNLSDEVIGYAHEIKIDAQRLLGEFLENQPKNPGVKTKGGGLGAGGAMREPPAIATLTSAGISKKESADAQFVAKIAREAPEEFEAYSKGKVSLNGTKRHHKRREMKEKLEAIAKAQPKLPTGKFDVMNFDPPWPVEKIERDCRPNQTKELAYPLMPVEEIKALDWVEKFAAENCHVFLWTTQKFLPVAFEVLKAWGAVYSFTMVWHKPGGFQPIGRPQSNCEFCLYGYRGKPEFFDTKNFFTCFNAPRRAHSEKPDEFYELLRRTTAGRRADCFNRRKIEGFVGIGLEAK